MWYCMKGITESICFIRHLACLHLFQAFIGNRGQSLRWTNFIYLSFRIRIIIKFFTFFLVLIFTRYCFLIDKSNSCSFDLFRDVTAYPCQDGPACRFAETALLQHKQQQTESVSNSKSIVVLKFSLIATPSHALRSLRSIEWNLSGT